MQFTLELENQSSLPFLDTKIIRTDNGELITDWYHKPTWSGRYLNFHSHLPLSYKINTISLLTRKVIELSDVKFHQKNYELVRSTLIQNGYPLHLIQRTMNETIIRLNSSGPVNEKQSSKYLSIPYNAVLFSKFKTLFEPYNIKTVAKPANSLGRLVFSNVKDKVPKEFVSNVVYSITCNCGAVYVGNTGQHMCTRFKQHLSGDENHSALSSHLVETGHSTTFDSMKILCSEKNRKVREVKEMLHIKTSTNINSQLDCISVGSYFDHVLSIFPA